MYARKKLLLLKQIKGMFGEKLRVLWQETKSG